MQMYSLILNLLMLHGRRLLGLVFSLSLLIRTDKKAGVRLITLRQVWCDIPASTVDLFLRPDWNLAATFCFFSSALQFSSSPQNGLMILTAAASKLFCSSLLLLLGGLSLAIPLPEAFTA